MAEEEQQSPNPIAPANGHPRSSDMEAAVATTIAGHEAKVLRKKKRTKRLLYIVLFVIFQTGVITLFALTLMKVRTPKFRMGWISVTTLNVGTPEDPSLRSRLMAEIAVKNTNFGPYKYQNTTVVFMYRGTQVGEFFLPQSRANWRSTRKFQVEVDLNLAKGQMYSDQLASDLNSRIVPITSQANLTGRVEMMLVIKKKRTIDMNCSMEIMTATKDISNLVCK